MKKVTVEEARANLSQLINEISQSGKPLKIMGKGNNAVLVSLDDWNGVQETLYLLGLPGTLESMREGLATPPEEMSTKLVW